MESKHAVAQNRARWYLRRRDVRAPLTATPVRRPASLGPREVLDTRYDERGLVQGPYDYSYRIDSGYDADRTVIRP